MIVDKMMLLTHEVKERVKREQKRLDAIASIRKLLAEIDFSAEVIPCEDELKLTRALESLKGTSLNPDESELVKEIIFR